MMKKNWIRIGIIIILTVVLMYFFLKSVEWGRVLDSLKNVDYKFFIPLILLTPIHLVTRAIRWHYLLMHEKKDTKFFNRFAGNAVGFFVTFIFPGRVGEVVKPIYLAQKEGMNKGFVVGTVVVERIFDLFTMCFLLGIFIVTRPLYASVFKMDEETSSNLFFWGIVGIASTLFLLLVILSLYFFKERTLKIVAFFLRPLSERLRQKIMDIIDEFIRGLKIFHSIGTLFVYIFWSIVVWVSIIFYYWIWLFAFNVRVPFFVVCPYVFLAMVGASIPTPGMAGGFDYFSKLGLTTLYGIEANQAVGMTIVVHAILVVVTYAIGYAILWKEGISLFQVTKMGEKTQP